MRQAHRVHKGQPDPQAHKAPQDRWARQEALGRKESKGQPDPQDHLERG